MGDKETSSYGSGRIFKHPRCKHWYAQYSVGGHQIRRSTGLRYDAKSNLNERRALEKLRGFIAEDRDLPGKSRSVTYDDLRDLLVRNYEDAGRKSLQSLKDSRLYNLNPFFKGWRASEIKEAVIDRYIEQRKKQGAAHATRNNELAALKRMFSLGVEKRLIPKSIVPTIKIEAAKNARTGFLEPALFERLRRELPDYLVGLVCWLYASGWRVGEARALKWEHVDASEGIATIEVGGSKNDEGRYFPYGDVELAREAIERATAKRLPECPYVFYRKPKRGGSWKKIGAFGKAWATAREAAATKLLEDEPANTSGAAMLRRVLVHDLRRSMAMNLTRAGASEQVAMKFVGHKTPSMFRRYNITGIEDMRRAALRLDGFIKAKAAAPVREGNKGETGAAPVAVSQKSA